MLLGMLSVLGVEQIQELGTCVRVASEQRHTFLYAQVADHEKDINAHGASANAVVVEVHVHDVNVIAATIHWPPKTSFCHQAFQGPLGVTNFSWPNRSLVVTAGSHVSLLKRTLHC